MIWVWIILGILGVFVSLIVYCACVLAAVADEEIERNKND